MYGNLYELKLLPPDVVGSNECYADHMTWAEVTDQMCPEVLLLDRLLSGLIQ